MTPPQAMPSTADDGRANAESSGARCALCGMSPPSTQDGILRQLGEAPLVITVCVDTDACVTRSRSAGR